MQAAEGTKTFFSGANPKVILGSPTLQTTSRRVLLPVRMPLTTDTFANMPDWISEGFQAVSRYLTEASPEVQQVSDLLLAFSNDKPAGEMFAHPSAKAPGCELKNFSITRVGDPDGDPEVELQFKAYIPYSREFWTWIGEMGGKEVYMAFPTSLVKPVNAKPAAEQGNLLDSKKETEEDVLSKDGKPDEEEAPRPKSGPKELAAYHKQQEEKGSRKQVH